MHLAQWIGENDIDVVAVTNPSTNYCFTCGSKVRACRVDSDNITTCIIYWCSECEAFVAIKDRV